MRSTILIVDDSESIREIVTHTLVEAGYDVVAGTDGTDGLRLLHQTPGVRLVISDLNMPRMDGIALMKEIRRSETFRYLPVIILTTESQQAKKIEARKAGATGWIIKPFDRENLVTAIKKVLR